jgi:hypothetical protein
MAHVVVRIVRFLRRNARRSLAILLLPGALTFDFLENLLEKRYRIRFWMWPLVVVLSLLEWRLVWIGCRSLETFGDASIGEVAMSACVRGDACVLQTDVFDGTETPTMPPSTVSPLLHVAASSNDLVLLAVHMEVHWSVGSLLMCSMKFAALSIYCALAMTSKVLMLLVWHPRCVVAVMTLLVAAAVLFGEDDGNSDNEQGSAESSAGASRHECDT